MIDIDLAETRKMNKFKVFKRVYLRGVMLMEAIKSHYVIASNITARLSRA